ncbi:MAG TPA: SRPBCC family protein [Solirubrobacteraceae bacterium]|nr:SRPBCC family protein [Solirubrobacteraceae bacterium]
MRSLAAFPMCSWHSNTTVSGSPTDVLALLTEPDAIARWAPVPFEVLALDGTRLESGSRARVAGRLAGRSVEFDVDVLRASHERFELVAQGPICIDVKYRVRPTGAASEVEASIAVEGRGLFGRTLAKATEALLAGGALRMSLERLAREVRPALAA